MFEKIVERKIFFKIRVFLTKGETEAHVAQGIILGGTDSMKIMIIYQKDGIGSDFIRNIVSFVNSMAGYNIRDFKANLLMGRILIVRGASEKSETDPDPGFCPETPYSDDIFSYVCQSLTHQKNRLSVPWLRSFLC